MKKLILICLCILTGMNVAAQDFFVVEKKDNTIVKFNVDDIKRMFFEITEPTPEPEPGPMPPKDKLASRLMDKEGNHVMLTKYNESGFTYDDDGLLTTFGYLEDTDWTNYVDGLSYHQAETGNHAPDTHDVTLTLNEDGYVSTMHFQFEELDINAGIVDDGFYGDLTFTYDSDGHLTMCQGTVSVYHRGELEATGTGTREFVWEYGDLVAIKTINASGRERTQQISYGDQVNYSRQYPGAMAELMEYSSEIDDKYLYMIGLFGKGPAHLPVSMPDDEGHQATWIFTQNDNGTIDTEQNSSSSESIEYEYKQ